MERYYYLVFALYRQVLSAKVNGVKLSPDFNRDVLNEISCEITRRRITNEPTSELEKLIAEVNKISSILYD